MEIIVKTGISKLPPASQILPQHWFICLQLTICSAPWKWEMAKPVQLSTTGRWGSQVKHMECQKCQAKKEGNEGRKKKPVYYLFKEDIDMIPSFVLIYISSPHQAELRKPKMFSVPNVAADWRQPIPSRLGIPVLCSAYIVNVLENIEPQNIHGEGNGKRGRKICLNKLKIKDV